MAGPTFQFLGFALLVALLLAANRPPLWRQGVMLAASAIFLASFSSSIVQFLPFTGFLLIGFIALRHVEKHPKRAMSSAIVGVLLIFFWVKKYAFIPSRLWLSFPYVTVGLSYILFRLLHLIIEVRGNPSIAGMPLRTYVTYLIGFNTLVAGPIQTFDEYAEQQAAPRGVSWTDAGEAAERIVLGMAKTNVLAALLSQWRDTSLARLTAGPSGGTHLLDAMLAFGLYPFFLYCNFSGYIDIVIGVSRLMSQRLPENFDRPFSATSVIEFWNRWHITLTRWLRTYVYNPLLLALLRRFPSRRLESVWAASVFFFTFFLIGVWHGQTTAFMFFGVLSGFGITVNKLFQLALTKRLGRKQYARVTSTTGFEALARGLNFTWFTFTLTWFWSSWQAALDIWASLPLSEWVAVWAAIFPSASLLLWIWEVARRGALSICWHDVPVLYSRHLRTAWITAAFVVVVAAAVLTNQSAPQIIYKDF